MSYANAMSTEDLDIKITKQVHDEIARLMSADGNIPKPTPTGTITQNGPSNIK